jgi:two-component system cell cycle sensor histidine kinase/response regulator CckA
MKDGERLSEVEVRYRAMFEHSPDGVLIIDHDGSIVEFNEAAHSQLGYTREEFTGLRISDLDPFQSPEEIQASIREVLSRGKTEFEVKHRTKGGEIRDVRVITQSMEVSGRTVFHSIWRDITEYKSMEERLRRSEERYRSLFEDSPVSLWEEDCSGVKTCIDHLRSTGVRDFRTYFESHPEVVIRCASLIKIIDVNNATLKLYGAGSKKQLLEGLGNVFEDESFNQFREQLIAIAEGKKMLECEVINRTMRGETIRAVLRWIVSPGYENTYARVLLSVVDVTEREKSERALRESENFLQTIIETEPECVKLLAADGTLLKMNRSGLAMIEADSLDQVIGKPVSSLVVPEYRRAFESLTEEVFQGRSGTMTFEMVGLKGRRLWLETRAVPLRNEKNEIIALLGITHDITERRRLEEQLRQAQKMEAVGQLAGGIAHDFNNILTAIIGYAGLLQMRLKEDDPMRSDVEEILSSSERAAHLTQSLLAFSRKRAINPMPVDLNEIVKKVESLLVRIIGEDIELRTTLKDQDLTVMADRGQMEQVLMNLCTNARDAMPDGGMLRIETAHAQMGEEYSKTHGFGNPGEYALITVADTGMGMDEKTRERIFEPFFTTKESGKGTGLGLALVYAIIKQHDGYIDVYSELNSGSVFNIYLPIVGSKVETTVTVEKDTLKGGTETILLAEDDKDVRKLTKEVLEKFGYTVVEARDGDEAVRAFIENRERIRLLVFDVVMPKKNGVEAYEKIRTISPDITVLFTSGYTDKVAIKTGVIGERAYFFRKPISPKDLLRKVRELLDI